MPSAPRVFSRAEAREGPTEEPKFWNASVRDGFGGSGDVWTTYARLGRTASENQRDGRTLAVFDIVASASSAASKAELALVDGRGYDDGGCVEQVGEGRSELHD
jgi:hypothetical protein